MMIIQIPIHSGEPTAIFELTEYLPLSLNILLVVSILPAPAACPGSVVVRDVILIHMEAHGSSNPVIGKKLAFGRVITSIFFDEAVAIGDGSAGGMFTGSFM